MNQIQIWQKQDRGEIAQGAASAIQIVALTKPHVEPGPTPGPTRFWRVGRMWMQRTQAA